MQSPIDNLQSSIDNVPLPPSTGIDTIQQNPTKSNGNSCVCARAHEAQRSRRVQEHSVPPNRQFSPSSVVPDPPTSYPDPLTSYPDPLTSYPAPTHVIPAKAGIPPPGTNCPQVPADSTYPLESPSPNRHANNRTKPNRRRAPKPPWPAILYPGNALGVPQHLQEYS